MDVHFLTSQGDISNFIYYIGSNKHINMRVVHTTSKRMAIFSFNDKTLNTLIDCSEEEIMAFPLESKLKNELSLDVDEVNMLDTLDDKFYSQSFYNTTSSNNTTSMSNMQEVPSTSTVQVMMTQLPQQSVTNMLPLVPLPQSSTVQDVTGQSMAEQMPQLPSMLSMVESTMQQSTMPQMTAMAPSTWTSMAPSTWTPMAQSTMAPSTWTSMTPSTWTPMTQSTMTSSTWTSMTQPSMSTMLDPQMLQSCSSMPQLTPRPGVFTMMSMTQPTMSTMVGPQQSMPPPPPVRSMDYYNVGQMTTMPQQQQLKQEYPVTETPMPQQPQQLKQEYPATDYQWNYIQVQQPIPLQSIIEDDRFLYQMRGLPAANSFNKPPYGFKSKVKIFISHLRSLVPSVNEGVLALLNVIDHNHYGVPMEDNGEYIFVHFNDNLEVHFKRTFIDYVVEGKVFDILLKFIFKSV